VFCVLLRVAQLGLGLVAVAVVVGGSKHGTKAAQTADGVELAAPGRSCQPQKAVPFQVTRWGGAGVGLTGHQAGLSRPAQATSRATSGRVARYRGAPP
jgi:hypothetical protein